MDGWMDGWIDRSETFLIVSVVAFCVSMVGGRRYLLHET